MNHIVISTDFEGREGLHDIKAIAQIARQGFGQLTSWAYANGILHLAEKRMDGTHVAQILKGRIK